MKVATTALLFGLTIVLASGSGIAPHPDVGVVIDNPLGDATVVNFGPGLYRIYWDITHVGGASACANTGVCGEYALKVFVETSTGVVVATTSYSDQLNMLRDSAELNSIQSGLGGTLDPAVAGYAGNVCGGGKNGNALDPDGPTSSEPDGNVWMDIVAPAGTSIFVGVISEQSAANFGCSGDSTQPTNFPGKYSRVSFSEAVVLV